MQAIDREELKNMLDKGQKLILVNVSCEEDFEDERIPGSKHVYFNDDDEDFVSQISNLAKSRDDLIIVYCRGMKWPPSVLATIALEKAGYRNVMAYEGGIRDWKKAPYPIEGENAESHTTSTQI